MHRLLNLFRPLLFYCFTSAMAGRIHQLSALGADDGAHQEPVERLSNPPPSPVPVRGQSGSHSRLRARWQMCRITSVTRVWLVWLDRRATGHVEGRGWEWRTGTGRRPHHLAPVDLSESAAPAPGKNSSLFSPSLSLSLWRQRRGIIKALTETNPF